MYRHLKLLIASTAIFLMLIGCQSNKTPSSISDTTPPLVKFSSATQQQNGQTLGKATVIISGYISDDNAVSAEYSHNKGSRQPVTILGGGAFTVSISLQVGTNTFDLYAIDNSGNEQLISLSFIYAPSTGGGSDDDTQNPVIVVASPNDGQVLNTNTITVTGAVTDNKGVTSLAYSLNGVQTNLTTSENFSFDVTLAEGANTIEITAKDAAGNEGKRSLTVTYTPKVNPTPTYTLTVSRTGQGTVISQTPGIDCGLDCTEIYNQGTLVTLLAMPLTGYQFDGWNGDCTGKSSCVVSLSKNTTVTANFSPKPIKLEVELFNIDDVEFVNINGQEKVLEKTVGTSSGRVDLTQYLNQNVNYVELNAVNNGSAAANAGNPFHYGFRVWWNGELILEDICGKTGQNCLAGDTTGGQKYFNRMIFRKDGTYGLIRLDKINAVTLLSRNLPLTATVRGLDASKMSWSALVPETGWKSLNNTASTYTFKPERTGNYWICAAVSEPDVARNPHACAMVLVPKFEARLFNVDDKMLGYVNGTIRLSANYREDTQKTDLSGFLDRDANEIMIDAQNGTGPWAYGMQVWLNDELILEDICNFCTSDTTSGYRSWRKFVVYSDGTYAIVRLTSPTIHTLKVGETYTGSYATSGRTGRIWWSYKNPAGNWQDFNGPSITFGMVGLHEVCVHYESMSAHCAYVHVTPTLNYNFIRSGWDAAKLDKVVAGNPRLDALTQRLADLGMHNPRQYLINGGYGRDPNGIFTTWWQCMEFTNAIASQAGRRVNGGDTNAKGPSVASLINTPGLEGTLVATFAPNGLYTIDAGLGWGHIAIFRRWVPGGIEVWDANYVGRGAAGIHTIPFISGTGGQSGNANNYSFVIWKQ